MRPLQYVSRILSSKKKCSTPGHGPTAIRRRSPAFSAKLQSWHGKAFFLLWNVVPRRPARVLDSKLDEECDKYVSCLQWGQLVKPGKAQGLSLSDVRSLNVTESCASDCLWISAGYMVQTRIMHLIRCCVLPVCQCMPQYAFKELATSEATQVLRTAHEAI